MKTDKRNTEQHQLQSQMQTAPFVKPSERASKDVSDMSMSDFAPKRFALKYEPMPMIVLEYLVPSTGKLYHHKMKLRQLKGDSDPDEMLAYLEKRHPLYFLQRKLSKPQIKNLIKKVIYRVSQMEAKNPKKPAPTTTTAPQASTQNKPKDSGIFSTNKRQHLRDLENKALEKENKNSGGLASLTGAPAFKTGSQLPTLQDNDFPPVGSSSKKPGVKFNDQFDDDFSEGSDQGGDDPESPNEANNDDDDEDEDGDFDANELLNLGDYQKKRIGLQNSNGPGSMGMGAGLGRDKESPLPSLSNPMASAKEALMNKIAPPAPAQRSTLGASAYVGADEAFDCSDSDEDLDTDRGFEEQKKVAANIDFNKFDYKKKDLNKLGDVELKAHKAQMEVGFQQNAVKKGDPGFMYDKRVDFKYNAEEAADDGWDDSDDSEEEGVEIVAQSRVLSKPKGVGLMGKETVVDKQEDAFDNMGADNDYFDDDFDDDLQ